MLLPPAKIFAKKKPFVAVGNTYSFCATYADAVKLAAKLRAEGKAAKAYKPLPPRL